MLTPLLLLVSIEGHVIASDPEYELYLGALRATTSPHWKLMTGAASKQQVCGLTAVCEDHACAVLA